MIDLHQACCNLAGVWYSDAVSFLLVRGVFLSLFLWDSLAWVQADLIRYRLLISNSWVVGLSVSFPKPEVETGYNSMRTV